MSYKHWLNQKEDPIIEDYLKIIKEIEDTIDNIKLDSLEGIKQFNILNCQLELKYKNLEFYRSYLRNKKLP
jgi:hypothetical protein